CTCLVSNFDRMVIEQFASAADVLHLVLFEQERNAVVHSIGDGTAPCNDLGEIHLCLDGKAVIASMVEELLVLCTLEQCFRWDAPPVEAHPAETVALNAYRLHAELGCSNCSYVAAWSSSNHHNIDSIRIHWQW